MCMYDISVCIYVILYKLSCAALLEMHDNLSHACTLTHTVLRQLDGRRKVGILTMVLWVRWMSMTMKQTEMLS